MDVTGFIAGSIGGAVGITVGHPFDTIKVRLQTQHGVTDMLKYKGLFDCFLQIVKQERVTGLYKGLTPPLLGVSAQNALMFGIQVGILKHFDSTTLRSHFYAGCITGAIQTVVSCLIDFSKIQLQMQGVGEKITSKEKRFKGPIDVFRKFYKMQGIGACFRGFWITFIRDIPATGAYFYCYAYSCEILARKHKSAKTLGVWELLLAGGLSGMISWALIYPIDVVKSRIQAGGFKPHGQYKNHLECIATCYQQEGLNAFTRGLGATMLRAFPLNAATLCTVTLVLRVLNPNDPGINVTSV